MTARDFRRIALGMTGAIESSHMGHPDFRAGGRIFSTLHADMKFGMVKLTPEEQRVFMREHPDVFEPEAGAWGRSGCTRVRLAAVDEETLGEAMTLAWRAVITPARTVRAPGARVSVARRRTASRSG